MDNYAYRTQRSDYVVLKHMLVRGIPLDFIVEGIHDVFRTHKEPRRIRSFAYVAEILKELCQGTRQNHARRRARCSPSGFLRRCSESRRSVRKFLQAVSRLPINRRKLGDSVVHQWVTLRVENVQFLCKGVFFL